MNNYRVLLYYHYTNIENPDEIAPYKYLNPAVQAMQTVVEKRMALFAGL